MTQKRSPSGKPARLTGTVVVDIASVPAASVALTSVPIPGVQVGDTVFLTPSANPSVAVGILPGYCAVAGTAIFPVVNPTAGALDPASATYRYAILRPV
jgi:hypothetical protein